jgi:ankyrin repeat protein
MKMRATRVVCATLVASLLSAGAASAAGDRQLADAAKKRDGATVKRLLNDRAEVNGRQPDGATALHWAAHWNEIDMARLLVRAGAEVNAANDFGVTPLHLACTNASLAMVEALLEAGANPNLAMASGETSLMTAARSGNVAVVDVLLARGATLEAKESTQGQTALMWAVAEGHTDVVRRLIERGANVNERSKRGYTPLLFAARNGDLDLTNTLLSQGANVNDAAPDGATALLVSTVRGHVPLATLLLEKGADPNADGAGYTPLHWASGSWETELTGPRGIVLGRDEEWVALRGLEGRKIELVRALLARGAKPNVQVTRPPPRVGFSVFRTPILIGATPFFLAAMAGDAATMRVLADAGADPKMTVKDGTTPLMAASGVARVLAESRVTATASFEAARVAWELGNDVNATNTALETALHGAAHIRGDALVQFLADKGAKLDAKNKRGETPLVIAERSVAAGSAPVVERTSTGDLLRKLGAQDADATDATKK